MNDSVIPVLLIGVAKQHIIPESGGVDPGILRAVSHCTSHLHTAFHRNQLLQQALQQGRLHTNIEQVDI